MSDADKARLLAAVVRYEAMRAMQDQIARLFPSSPLPDDWRPPASARELAEPSTDFVAFVVPRADAAPVG